MNRPSVLALVLAGGEGSRLGPLTDEREAGPPVCRHLPADRLPLSNCLHSGIGDVWVIQQYEPYGADKAARQRTALGLDRTRGGLRILHPYLGDSESGWYEGNADAIYSNRQVIADQDPDVLLVLSADHVYKLDYSEVVAHHLDSGAAVTMVTTSVPNEEAARYGVVGADGDGRVSEFEYKPEAPGSDVITTEVFAYEARSLLRTLDELAEEGDGSSIRDFGHELLPRLVAEGAARAFELDGYWRDVGTVDSYWEAHMELLADEPPLTLDDPAWPILTMGLQRRLARIEGSATIDSCLVAGGRTSAEPLRVR